MTDILKAESDFKVGDRVCLRQGIIPFSGSSRSGIVDQVNLEKGGCLVQHDAENSWEGWPLGNPNDQSQSSTNPVCGWVFAEIERIT